MPWNIDTKSACLEHADLSSASMALRATIAERRLENADRRRQQTEDCYQNEDEDHFDEADVPVQEVGMLIHYLDRGGMPQFSNTRTSEGLGAFNDDPNKLRKAINTYFDSLGCVLLGVEMSVENTSLLAGTRQRPNLRLVTRRKPYSAEEIDIRL